MSSVENNGWCLFIFWPTDKSACQKKKKRIAHKSANPERCHLKFYTTTLWSSNWSFLLLDRTLLWMIFFFLPNYSKDCLLHLSCPIKRLLSYVSIPARLCTISYLAWIGFLKRWLTHRLMTVMLFFSLVCCFWVGYSKRIVVDEYIRSWKPDGCVRVWVLVWSDA